MRDRDKQKRARRVEIEEKKRRGERKRRKERRGVREKIKKSRAMLVVSCLQYLLLYMYIVNFQFPVDVVYILGYHSRKVCKNELVYL